MESISESYSNEILITDEIKFTTSGSSDPISKRRWRKYITFAT